MVKIKPIYLSFLCGPTAIHVAPELAVAWIHAIVRGWGLRLILLLAIEEASSSRVSNSNGQS